MKVLAVTFFFSMVITPCDFLPKVALLVMMFGAMVADLVTGLIKAYVLRQKITSKALRQTIIKFCQYGGAILIGLGISYMSTMVVDYNESWKYAPKFMSFFNNSLLIFIILIELRSIIENLVAMDKNSQMSKNLFAPALKILNIQIKNNPVAKLTFETDEEVEVTQETIKSKNIVK